MSGSSGESDAGQTHRLQVAAAVVWRDERLLLTQRPPGTRLGLMWEFPGGKVEDGETVDRALRREIHEELGVNATPHEVMDVDTHDYPHGLEVEIAFVRCTLDSYDFHPSTAVHAVRWVRPQDVRLDEVLAGDRDFLRSLGANG